MGPVWLRGQYRDWRARRAAIEARNWNGYIDTHGISDWFVTLAEDPATPDAHVMLRVTGRDGKPDEQRAQALRRVVENTGRPAGAPSDEQMAFLIALRGERFGKGYPLT